MKKQKLRLTDLEEVSKENAARREATLRNLCALPLPSRAADIKRVVQEGYPPLMDEMLVFATRAFTASLRFPKPSLVSPQQRRADGVERKARLIEAVRPLVRYVEVGSKAIELLDTVLINGKMLGDCTSRDLQIDIHAETQRAETIYAWVEWKTALMKLLEPNETVRTARDRQAVISVLERKPTRCGERGRDE